MSEGDPRRFGRAFGDAVVKRLGRVAARLQERSPVPADVLESEEEVLVVLDAPGATAGDVQVHYDEGTVRVRIDRFREYRDGFEMRYPGRGLALDASVDLPSDVAVDPEGARAVLRDDGTLRVFLPKAEPGEGADIAVAPEGEPVAVGEGDESDDDGGADQESEDA